MISDMFEYIKKEQLKETAGIFVVIHKEGGHVDSYLATSLSENNGNLEIIAEEKDRFICPCCEAKKIADEGQ